MPKITQPTIKYLPREGDEEIYTIYSPAFVLSAMWRSFVIGTAVGATLVGAIVTASLARAETLDGDRITIIDGDTIALPCDPLRGLYPGCAERIRLEGIDAPETFRARCDAERAAGYEAKAALAEMLRGHAIEITRTGRDRYGRTLAKLTADGRDVDTAMLAAGAAIPYAPGRAAWGQRCRHWCPTALRCEE